MERLTPIQAIRLYCLNRCASRKSEVKDCVDIECTHFEFRLGHNPARKGIGRKKNLEKDSEGKFIKISATNKKGIILEGRYRLVKIEDIEGNNQ